MNKRSLALSVAGFVLLSLTMLLVQNQSLAGVCCVTGLLLFFAAGFCFESRSDALLILVLLWLGYTVRFSRVLTPGLQGFLLSAVFNLPLALLLWVSFLLSSALKRRGHPALSVLVIPVFYTLSCILYTIPLMGFISDTLVFWMCRPYISENLSWSGVFFMDFLLSGILAALASAVPAQSSMSRVFRILPSVAVFALLLLAGSVLMSDAPPDYTLKVAVGTCEKSGFANNDESDYTTDDRLSMFSSALDEAVRLGAEFLVTNEDYILVHEKDVAEAEQKISSIIRDHGIPVLLCYDRQPDTDPANTGADSSDESLALNQAVYYDRDGNELWRYTKYSLVPVIESPYYVAGDGVLPDLSVQIGGHEVNISFMICFDLDNSFYVRSVPERTELLIAPSWDWDDNNMEQVRTWIRSVELETTLLKHTYDGFSLVSGPSGSIRQLLDFREVYETVRLMDVPIWEKS